MAAARSSTAAISTSTARCPRTRRPAYFQYVNDQGGICGRKIIYIPCDTAAPPTARGAAPQAGRPGQGLHDGPVAGRLPTSTSCRHPRTKQLPGSALRPTTWRSQRSPLDVPDPALRPSELGALIATLRGPDAEGEERRGLVHQRRRGADCTGSRRPSRWPGPPVASTPPAPPRSTRPSTARSRRGPATPAPTPCCSATTR